MKLGAMALFEGVSRQSLKKGFIARSGQILDASARPGLISR